MNKTYHESGTLLIYTTSCTHLLDFLCIVLKFPVRASSPLVVNNNVWIAVRIIVQLMSFIMYSVLHQDFTRFIKHALSTKPIYCQLEDAVTELINFWLKDKELLEILCTEREAPRHLKDTYSGYIYNRLIMICNADSDDVLPSVYVDIGGSSKHQNTHQIIQVQNHIKTLAQENRRSEEHHMQVGALQYFKSLNFVETNCTDLGSGQNLMGVIPLNLALDKAHGLTLANDNEKIISHEMLVDTNGHLLAMDLQNLASKMRAFIPMTYIEY